MSGGSFRGVSAAQDGRFDDKTKKLLKSTKFPDSFSQKVDMRKVRMEAMMPWIQAEVAKYIGLEDDIVVNYIESQLQEANLDPRKMQIALTGFLERNTAPFMRDLWALLLSAQSHETGIPAAFLDKKKEELQAKKEEQARLEAELRMAAQKAAAAIAPPPAVPAPVAATATAAAAAVSSTGVGPTHRGRGRGR